MKDIVGVVTGGTLASWVALGSGAAAVQTIVGPETAMDVGLAVNVGMLLAATVMVFRAGGIFKVWLDAVNGALQFTEIVRKLETDVDRLEKELLHTRAKLLEQERITAELKNRLGFPLSRKRRDG
jgi:hypothetical protein